MNYAGTIDVVELPALKSWDPRSGWTITRRFRGSPAAVSVVASSWIASGNRVQIESAEDGSFDTLGVILGAEDTQPANLPLADQWSLVGNDLEKSLWTLPAIVAEMDKVSIANTDHVHALSLLRTDVEAFARGETSVPDPQNPGSTMDLTLSGLQTVVEALGMSWPVWLALITSMARGEEAWSVSQFVLRHTLTISANSSIRPSYDGVGRVYSSSTLIGVEQIPNTLKFVIPDGYWLKRTPTVEQTAADKYQITQEWWHAESYDLFIYGSPL